MASEESANDTYNGPKIDDIHVSSKQKTAMSKNLPASKVFDLKVVPSEGIDEFDTAHSFCHTVSHSFCR